MFPNKHPSPGKTPPALLPTGCRSSLPLLASARPVVHAPSPLISRWPIPRRWNLCQAFLPHFPPDSRAQDRRCTKQTPSLVHVPTWADYEITKMRRKKTGKSRAEGFHRAADNLISPVADGMAPWPMNLANLASWAKAGGQTLYLISCFARLQSVLANLTNPHLHP